MKSLVSRSFRLRLMGLIVLALLPALALILLTATTQRRELLDRSRQEAQRITRLAAGSYESLVTGGRQLLTSLAHNPTALSDEPDACVSLFEDLVTEYPRYSRFGVIDPDGNITCTYPLFDEPVNVADRDYFQHAAETGEFTVGRFLTGRVTGNIVVVLANPILDENGDLDRVIIASLGLSWLEDIANEIDLPSNAVLLLVNREATIFARYPELDQPDAEIAASAPILQTLTSREAETDTIESAGFDGIARYYAYTQLPTFGRGQDVYLATGFPVSEVLAPANSLLMGYLVALVLVVLLAFAAVWFGGNVFIMRPMDVLFNAARRLSMGDLSTRIGRFRGPHELASLAHAFDDMAAQLELRDAERKRDEAEIRRLNADLEARVIERTAQLEATNHELEAFTYSVSHDLRAPLRAIDGFSRIVLNEYAPQIPPEAQRYLDRVRDAAQRMGHLIDDLLAFSRLGRQAMKPQVLDPANIVRQVLAELEGEMENRQIEIDLGDLPACTADPALLRQVYGNLLANAIKFTKGRESARIEVGSQRNDDEIVYFVEDNGAGFDMRYVDKLFGVFQRLHGAEEYEGTGVGLATVQRIIHRHGGRIWAEGAVDQGATFYFTLGDDNDEHAR